MICDQQYGFMPRKNTELRQCQGSALIPLQMRSGRWTVMFADDIVICCESMEHEGVKNGQLEECTMKEVK